MNALGSHFLVELWEASNLDNPPLVEEALVETVRRSKGTLLDTKIVEFPNGACSGVAIISESFPPDINGVAHSVVRVAEQLVVRGHRPLVIAPEPASGTARVAGRSMPRRSPPWRRTPAPRRALVSPARAAAARG